MKLRNKKTGEIKDVESLGHADSLKGKFGYQVTLSWKIDEHLDTCKTYNSLAELNEEWEDYEEPKEYWYMSNRGDIRFIDDEDTDWDNDRKQIGNYFETKEEAEKAVEKLKAVKRLKDKGFEYRIWKWEYIYNDNISGELIIKAHIDDATDSDGKYTKDLDLLFGGEE